MEISFRNCFSIAYTDTLFYSAESLSHVINDFSTTARKIPGGTFLHHSDNPDIPDNKLIFYQKGGMVVKESYRDYIKRNAAILPQDQRKNLFLYETDETKKDLGSFCFVFGTFLKEDGIRMNKRAILSKKKGKNYIMLGDTCHMIFNRTDTLTLIEICRALKIIIMVIQEVANKHRFIAKGAPKSRAKLDEFISENSGMLTTLNIYNTDKCGVKLTPRGRNLSSLTPESCLDIILKGTIPSTQ